MSKNIIVSNRLPIKISKVDNSFEFTPTSGGLATGLKSFHNQKNSLWVGWPGIGSDKIDKILWPKLQNSLKKNNYCPVNLSSKEIQNFYYGLPNKCLWPLFHYFIEKSSFNESNWKHYVEINKRFSDVVLSKIEKGDTIWIHDYQLMLCPKMIKDSRPDVKIGFFLHIPFPSFEIFRTFPRRKSLLKGVLGADLIGFHTYDYERHFLSSVKRLLRYEVNFNKINLGIREVVVNTFPMGIDYDKFNKAAIDHYSRKASQQTELKKQIELHKKSVKDGKLILSIDRLDYTKGVLNRVKAFEQFLNKFPDYLEKVRLVMLTVPSRSEEPQYKKLKKETDEIVGRVNGEYATVNWTPIWYYYRSMNFDELIDLYSSADIAMITPIRDGMNLVAKEFVSTRINGDGVLILSELAGASKELFQALTVNPFDINSMSNTIHDAINMGIDEQKQRNFSMQKRIKRYTVKYWADEFISSLNEISVVQENGVLKIDDKSSEIIKENYKKSSNKLILLDYDGTLVEFNEKPGLAIPDNETFKILKDLSQENDVAIISGRDQHFLDKHFSDLKLTLVAEHGYFTRNYSESWSEKANFNKDRIKSFKPILDSFSDRTPGTFVEEKLNSIVWHYRKSDPELANSRVVEFKTVFDSLSTDGLNLMDMDKAIEIINAQVNKGSAVSEIISNKDYDFILCIGDDITDENMFESLPKNSYTIKVGKKKTSAKYYIKDPRQVKTFLSFLTK